MAKPKFLLNTASILRVQSVRTSGNTGPTLPKVKAGAVVNTLVLNHWAMLLLLSSALFPLFKEGRLTAIGAPLNRVMKELKSQPPNRAFAIRLRPAPCARP